MSNRRQRQLSQCALILARLKTARGGWVTMPELSRCSRSLNVHTRIDELRSQWGVTIENHTDVSVRPHVSKYRLTKGKV
jgi:hypothetical protein